MLSMKCHDCAMKHCAGMLSYAKEILGGHAEGNPLDHRIDLLGEAVNLEHHLELIDQRLLVEAQELRRQMQAHGMAVTERDLQRIRDLYDAIAKNAVIPTETRTEASPEPARSRDGYVVVIDSPRDSGRFQEALRGVMENVLNQVTVYVLNPEIDIEENGFTTVRKPTRDFVEALDDDMFVYMTENDFIINKCDLNLLPDCYLAERVENPELYSGCKTYPYKWDCGAPHVLEKEKFLKTYNENENLLDCYYIRNEIKPVYNSFTRVARISQKLCCSNRSLVEGGCIFATALDDAGFASLREWLLTRRQR